LCLLVTISLLLAASAPAGPHKERLSVDGEAAYDHFGSSVAGIGDVDGDGYPDWIAGAPDGNYAKVVSGLDGSVIYRVSGRGGDGFGAAVGAAGDVNGDGIPDFIVGAPSNDYAVVFSGLDGSTLLTVRSQYGSEYFGAAVDGVGDLNGDGYGDFAVGATYGQDPWGNPTGSAYVFSGIDGGTIYYFYTGNYREDFGCSVAGVGDVSGDGVPDILIGAQNGYDWYGYQSGAAYLISGADGSNPYVFFGDSSGSQFGKSVDGTGDVDGDGLPDIVVGAPYEYNSATGAYGMVRVLSGYSGSVLHTAKAAEGQDLLGDSVSGAGDLDSDGYAEWIAGAPSGMAADGKTQTGVVVAWSGKDGEPIFSVSGVNAGEYFGAAVAAAGDTNEDGRDDFIVGVSRESKTATESGCACLFVSPSPEGTISINGGALATTSSTVTLSLAWTATGASVASVRVRNAGESFGSWISLASSMSWTLTSGEGSRTVEVQYLDADGLTSRIESDSIVVDQTSPTGTFALEGGAAWTCRTTVDVTLEFEDGGAGVAEARFRNKGGAWGEWQDAAGPITWALTSGAGAKTVEGECRDFAGNTSDLASDTISVDLNVPTGAVIINGGAKYLLAPSATVAISASDLGGSGLAGMRYRTSDVAGYSGWVPCASAYVLVFGAVEGEKRVDFQFRDGAGNVSATASDTAIFDCTPPSVLGLSVNGGRKYLLPGEPVAIKLYPKPDVSGTESFKASFDGGATWSEWVAFKNDPVAVGRPAVDGPVSVSVVLRDYAGNESVPISAGGIYSVGAGAASLGTSGTFAGSLSDAADIDAVFVDLVRGDLLTVRLAAAGAAKKSVLPAVLDLAKPTGERVLTGVTGVASWGVPETGRYVLVVRQESGQGAGTYSLSVSVKQAKTNAGGKASVTTGEVSFEAAAGTALKASLNGAGLDPASVTIVGPDGAVTATVAGKPGSAKLTATLNAGTGVYRIRFSAPGPVAVSFGSKLPKGKSVTEPKP